jgi:uncharacterized membrane protein YidH (DUF202 family)
MRSPDEPYGAARERTGLAWQRSASSLLALGGVVLSVSAHRDAPALLAVSAALLAVAGAAWRHGHRAYARAEVSAHPRALGLLTAATTLSALVAAVVVSVRL